jgi:choline dehydrogenase-like flavoprotein
MPHTKKQNGESVANTVKALRGSAVISSGTEDLETDILIIGSGMGGGTLAWALRNAGQDVIIAERGDFLPREPENSQPKAVFMEGRYKTAPAWVDERTETTFQPGTYYWVGGSTKMYGACLPRFRVSDFQETQHADGVSPAWPFTYDDLEPYYSQAEQLYRVRGQAGEDPTEPPRSSDYHLPALEHEPVIARFSDALKRQGLKPFHMPSGMDLNTQDDRRKATAADGSPSEDGSKSDAETCAVRPALEAENVRIVVNATVTKLLTDPTGTRVVAAEITEGGRTRKVHAKKFVVSGGAVNSTVLLLNSANPAHPDGLGNSSGLLGRNYMAHNSTFLMGINPFERNTTAWQKTLGLHDWYESTAESPYPLGSVQMLGKLQGTMVKGARPWIPLWALETVTRRSLDMFLLTEDLPVASNRVTTQNGRVRVHWEPNNLQAHKELTAKVSKAVKRAGYPIVLTERMGIASSSHMCGTAVAGTNPSQSVLDPFCRSHDVENLWIVDSSFFPSSGGLNPALTIAANALRVAPNIINS